MFEELVIGFDCREMWLPDSEVFIWTDKDHLLNTSAERFLTINRNTWKSVFLPPLPDPLQHHYYTAPGYRLKIPEEETTYYMFWHDLDEMKDFMRRNSEEYELRCWLIAITLLNTPVYKKLQSRGFCPTADNEQVDSQWTLLGYDVEDRQSFNLGLGTTFPGELHTERKERWGNLLNRYYLFSNQQDAVNYADWHSEIYPGAGPMLIFGMYLVEDRSAAKS